MKKIILLIYFVNITVLSATNYNLNTDREIIINSVSLAAFTIGHFGFETDTLEIDKLYDISEINFIDKAMMFPYNPKAAMASDILLLWNVASPIVFNSQQFTEDWTIPVMYGETLLATSAITYLVKKIFKRPRPYNFYKDAPKEQIENFDSQLSFFSGHSSLSFSSAVFNSIIYEKYNPNSDYKNLVWAISLTSAATTATLRVLAGKHYFSDIVVGAIVGSLVSYYITEIHEVTPVNGEPMNVQLIGIRVGL